MSPSRMDFDPPELDRDPAYWRAVALVSARTRDLHRLALARVKIRSIPVGNLRGGEHAGQDPEEP